MKSTTNFRMNQFSKYMIELKIWKQINNKIMAKLRNQLLKLNKVQNSGMKIWI